VLVNCKVLSIYVGNFYFYLSKTNLTKRKGCNLPHGFVTGVVESAFVILIRSIGNEWLFKYPGLPRLFP
jgi:hypothetical protein